MRIRKNASKLLGSAILYLSAPFPPPSDTWDPPSSSNPSLCSSSGELCELNQSPWDIYPNLHLFTSSSTEDVDSYRCLKEETLAKEEAHEEKVLDAILENDRGILVKPPEKKSIEIESEAKALRLCKRVDVPKSKGKKTKMKKDKKKTAKTKKNDHTAVILCKKNDGKKWFCKRPALLPHSFCKYHYSQSRSYYPIQKDKEDSDELESSCKRNKRKENEATSTNPYYYYGGVWPSRTKRRGARNAEKCDDAMHVDDDKKVGHCEAWSVAGGAEEDCMVDDDKEISSSDGVEMRGCKKRKRKPINAFGFSFDSRTF